MVSPISIPFLGVVTRLQQVAFISLALALVVALAWGFRVDSLRSTHKERIDAVVVQLKSAFEGDENLREDRGFKVAPKNAASLVKRLADDRMTYRAERDSARSVLRLQSGKIIALEEETQRLKRLSEDNAKMARKVIEERNVWIARARAAATRTERLAAEQELVQCQEVLDALFQAGF